MVPQSDFFLHPVRRDTAVLRLFCFAHAGGGASMFARWAMEIDPRIEVIGVQSPGRETRFAESPARSMDSLVEQIAKVFAEQSNVPFAFFGHSMGALVAFELARELRRRRIPGPGKLLLSAFRAPGGGNPAKSFVSLPDEEFLACVCARYGALPAAIANDKELLAYYLPAMRGDLEILATHQLAPGEPLECPFVLYNGVSDQLICPADLKGWRNLSTGGCSERWFPGGHFYLREQRRAVLRAITADLLEQDRTQLGGDGGHVGNAHHADVVSGN